MACLRFRTGAVMVLRRSALILGTLALSALSVVPAHGDEPGPDGCDRTRATVVHRGSDPLEMDGTFVPCLIDTGMTTGESGLAIDSAGALFRSVATGPPGLAVSTDDGVSWARRELPPGATTMLADGYLDPVTDRYFYTGFGSGPVYSTDDRGSTWTAGTLGRTPLPGDWPRVFSGRPVTLRDNGYPTNTYYCNWTVPIGVTSGFRCYTSTDGGGHFTPSGPDIGPEVCADPLYTPGTVHGRGIVDPRNGTIYLTISVCGRLDVAVSTDEGASWTRRPIPGVRLTGFTALLDTIDSPAWREQNLGGRLNPVGPELSAGIYSDSIAMDALGRLYVVWVDAETYLPRLAASSDGGTSWSVVESVVPEGVVQATLPGVTVTRGGRVGLSYYGSTDKRTWTGYLAITDDAVAPVPIFQTATVTPADRPLMPEPCCWANGLQEYTMPRWAPDGSLWAAFAGSRPAGDFQGLVGRLVPRDGRR